MQFKDVNEAIVSVRLQFHWDHEQKLNVDEGDEVYHIRCFYPIHPHIVQYRDQDASDEGGVSPQLFTKLFGCFQVQDKFFEGQGMIC